MTEPYWPWWAVITFFTSGAFSAWVLTANLKRIRVSCPNCHERVRVPAFRDHWRECSRPLHRLYARARGYFWLPCPVCGIEHGGHERPWGRVSSGGDIGWMYCAACVKRYGDELIVDQNTIDTCRRHGVPLALVVHDLGAGGSES